MGALELERTNFMWDKMPGSAHMKLANAIPWPLWVVAYGPALQIVGPPRPGAFIAAYNDHHATHDDILALFDRAIETEKLRLVSPPLVPALDSEVRELVDVA